MALLREGKYSLSTDSKTNKSLIFVKLTDSAIQSIEGYLKSKDDSVLKPSIEFKDSSGTISFPLNGTKQSYGFTLSNVEADGQNSLQCIQHPGNRSLESLGFMLMKMQIRATEDSYEKTKFKMAAADQEQKSFCTKEIKQNGSRLAKKVKVNRPGLSAAPGKNLVNAKNVELPRFSSGTKPTNSVSFLKQPIRDRIIHILAAKPYKKPELLLRLKKEGINERDKDRVGDILLDVGTLKGCIFSLSRHLWNEVKEDWELCSEEESQLIQRRKRQFLKPNSQNEVLDHVRSSFLQKKISSEPVSVNKPCNKKQRLSFNGVKNCNRIPKDVTSVPDKSVKTNTSVKTNGFLPESSVKTNGFHPESSVKSNGFHPESSVKTNGILSDDSQRSPYPLKVYGDCNGIADMSKKNSLVNCKKDLLVNGKRKCSLDTPVNQSNGLARRSSECLSDKNIKRSKYLKPIHFIQPLSVKSYNSQIGCDIEHLPTNSDLELDFTEETLKYPEIESVEQRSQYVQDFDVHYEEYLKLHSYMKDIYQKFTSFCNRLEGCEKGSDECQKIKAQMAKEYEKNCKSYIPAQKRYMFLKSKLTNIRELVIKYDNKVINL